MSDETQTAEEAVVALATGGGAACGVCCRRLDAAPDAASAGFLPLRFVGAVGRTGVPACPSCALLVFAGDWAGLEGLVFDYLASEWTWWERITRRRRARRTSATIRGCAERLFGHMSEDRKEAHRG